MKKVLVIGSGGAGKSTFSRRLHEITKLELIHLDIVYWKPNWVETSKPEWFAKLAELLEKDSWIMDGNYDGSLEMRLEKCDTAIFLDMPRVLCLYRVLKRALKYRNATRPDMADGCNEKVDRKFAEWIWDYPNKDKIIVEEKLQRFEDKRKIIRLKSKREVENFLMNFKADKVKSF
jgi:adenylate kinase family enzyme